MALVGFFESELEESNVKVNINIGLDEISV
jgi:hypothetical protein